MKKVLLLLSAVCFCNFAAHADTLNLDWINEDGTIYAQTTCNAGGDVVLPNTPTKYGYTFTGWKTMPARLEYIESTGTQWIDTDFAPNNTLVLQLKIQRTDVSGGSSFVGCEWRARSPLAHWDAGRIKWHLGGTLFSSVLALNQDYIVELSNGKIIQNDEVYTSTTQSSYTCTSTFKILGGISGNYSPSSAKIYFIKMYNDNTLVRDMVPALDYNDVPCMYDQVTKKFFYNAGTGDFIAGPVIDEL